MLSLFLFVVSCLDGCKSSAKFPLAWLGLLGAMVLSEHISGAGALIASPARTAGAPRAPKPQANRPTRQARITPPAWLPATDNRQALLLICDNERPTIITTTYTTTSTIPTQSATLYPSFTTQYISTRIHRDPFLPLQAPLLRARPPGPPALATTDRRPRETMSAAKAARVGEECVALGFHRIHSSH